MDVSAALIGENTTFKFNVKTDDPASVNYIVEEFSSHFGGDDRVDLFVVTDRVGKVLARLSDPENHGDDLTTRPSIRRALRGEFREVVEAADSWPELWEVDHHLFQVASVPLYLADTIIGTITLGSKIGEYEATQLKGGTSIDISFVIDGMLIGSTVETLAQEHINAFRAERGQDVETVLEKLKASEPFEGVLGSQEVFAFISPLGQGEAAYYLASVPVDLELRILRTLQTNIYLTAGISLLITVLLAFVLGRTLSRPILRLVEGMNQVKGGDLNVELQATTSDEIGLLTNTFNEMIGGLRERLQLMKYVGSHT